MFIKTTITILIAVILISCNGGSGKPGDKNLSSPKDLYDSVAYVQGFINGMNMRIAKMRDSVKIDLDYYFKGVSDGLDSNYALVDSKYFDTVDIRFQQAMAQKEVERQKLIEDEYKKRAEANASLGPKFLDENKSKEGVKVTSTGLQYKVLNAGKGPKPEPTAFVRFHIITKLVDGSVIDDTYKKNQPISAPVDKVIPGWQETFRLMNVGSKFEVVLPPQIAFGENGAGNMIPPNAVLVSTIELLEIIDEATFRQDMERLMQQQQAQMPPGTAPRRAPQGGQMPN